MKTLRLYHRVGDIDIPAGVVVVPAIPAIAAIIAVYITAVTGLLSKDSNHAPRSDSRLPFPLPS